MKNLPLIILMGLFYSASNAQFAFWSYTVNGLDVTFTNTSTGTPPLFSTWNYGDGSTASINDSVHTYTYASGGSYTACLTVSNSQGVDSTCKTINLVTGIDQQKIDGFQIYPNPAKDKIWISNIRFSEPGFRMFDAKGRSYPVEVERSGDGLLINTEPLPPGVYTLIISEGDDSYSRKLLIE